MWPAESQAQQIIDPMQLPEEEEESMFISFKYKGKQHKTWFTYSKPIAYMSSPAYILNVIDSEYTDKCKGKFHDPTGTANEGCIVTIQLELNDDGSPKLPQDATLAIQLYGDQLQEIGKVTVDEVTKT